VIEKISVIIVTHNSKAFLKKSLTSLACQAALPNEVIIVDSGSEDCEYLQKITSELNNLKIKIKYCDNVGFAKANNIGIKLLSKESTRVIFLNPDCFLHHNFISILINIIKKKPAVGLITGKLEAYDLAIDCSTGVLDSTGIFQTYLGRWYDRGQGEIDYGQFDVSNGQIIPAACGALMVCQKNVIDEIIKKDSYFFNEDFFMYKEDIEISLRIQKSGRDILYFSELLAYHCRGWRKHRKLMPRWARLFSARNDLIIALKFRQRAFLFACLKYILVLVFDI